MCTTSGVLLLLFFIIIVFLIILSNRPKQKSIGGSPAIEARIDTINELLPLDYPLGNNLRTSFFEIVGGIDSRNYKVTDFFQNYLNEQILNKDVEGKNNTSNYLHSVNFYKYLINEYVSSNNLIYIKMIASVNIFTSDCYWNINVRLRQLNDNYDTIEAKNVRKYYYNMWREIIQDPINFSHIIKKNKHSFKYYKVLLNLIPKFSEFSEADQAQLPDSLALFSVLSEFMKTHHPNWEREDEAGKKQENINNIKIQDGWKANIDKMIVLQRYLPSSPGLKDILIEGLGKINYENFKIFEVIEHLFYTFDTFDKWVRKTKPYFSAICCNRADTLPINQFHGGNKINRQFTSVCYGIKNSFIDPPKPGKPLVPPYDISFIMLNQPFLVAELVSCYKDNEKEVLLRYGTMFKDYSRIQSNLFKTWHFKGAPVYELKPKFYTIITRFVNPPMRGYILDNPINPSTVRGPPSGYGVGDLPRPFDIDATTTGGGEEEKNNIKKLLVLSQSVLSSIPYSTFNTIIPVSKRNILLTGSIEENISTLMNLMSGNTNRQEMMAEAPMESHRIQTEIYGGNIDDDTIGNITKNLVNILFYMMLYGDLKNEKDKNFLLEEITYLKDDFRRLQSMIYLSSSMS